MLEDNQFYKSNNKQQQVVTNLEALRKLKQNYKQQPNLIEDSRMPPIQINAQNLPQIQPQIQKNHQKYLNEVRRNFQTCLSKLVNTETQSVAIRECQNIIQSNKTQDNLRTWIQLLNENLTQADGLQHKELIVLLVGFVAQLYGEELLDPLDKPSNLLKSSFRLCETLIKCFKDGYENIQKACSKSWREIYQNCLINQSVETRQLIIFDSLLSVICGGSGRVSQQTAILCTQDLVGYLCQQQDHEFLYKITNKFIPIFFKHANENPRVIHTLSFLIKTLDIQIFNPVILPILEKSKQVLGVQTNQGIAVKIKLESLQLLKLIAIKYQSITDALIGSYHDYIIEALKDATKDRVIKVQQGAKNAILEWQKLDEIYKYIEEAKTKNYNHLMDKDELIKLRTSKNMIQQNQKLRQQLQNDFGDELEIEDIHKDREETKLSKIFEKEQGWVSETQAKFFQKKKQGTGGGFIELENQRKRPQTAMEIQKDIRNRIDNYDFSKRSPEKKVRSKSPVQSNISEFEMAIRQNPNYIDYGVKYHNDPPIQQYNEVDQKKPIKIQEKFQQYQMHKQIVQNIQQQQLQNQEVDSDQDTVKEDSSLEQSFEEPFVINKQEIFDKKTNNDQKNFIDFQNKNTKKMFEDLKKTREVQLDENNVESMHNLWSEVLDYISMNNLELAYEKLLNAEDDIYLLRLLAKTGPCLKELRRPTAVRLLKRIMLILKSKFLHNLCLNTYQEIIDQGLANNLYIEEQNKIISNLKRYSRDNDAIGQKSQDLIQQFNQILLIEK